MVTSDTELCDAVLAELGSRPNLGVIGTEQFDPGDVVNVQVHHGWVCVSRLVRFHSCCADQRSLSGGHVHRTFDARSQHPIGIEDRRHTCGRRPDAVEVTELYAPGREAVDAFARRILIALAEALRAASAVTRAGLRGSTIAGNGRPQRAVRRRDFHLRSGDF